MKRNLNNGETDINCSKYVYDHILLNEGKDEHVVILAQPITELKNSLINFPDKSHVM